MRFLTAVATSLILNMGLGVAVVSAQSYRSCYGYRDADRAERIVRQAYLDILNREPDRSGMRQYTDAMLNRGWSEADVRRSLRSSSEFRELRRGDSGRGYDGRGYDGRGYDRGDDRATEVVRRAYLNTLGREPDSAGMREYRMRVVRDGWSERDIQRALRSSYEYRRSY
jgi:hypothetical protein